MDTSPDDVDNALSTISRASSVCSVASMCALHKRAQLAAL